MIRIVKTIYFNVEPSLNSSMFIRRLKFALKIISAFIISGLIAYGSPLRRYLDQQYIICVISILSLQETIGATVNSAIQTTMSLVPLSIVLFLIQIFGLSYKQYLATELLLLLFSFLIAYQCTQIQTRKITLLYNAIFFSTIVNEKSLPKIFVFLLLSLFLIGMFISIVTSLIIFPLFATIDIENRFSYCLKNLQRMYYSIIQAFLSEDQMNAKIYLSRASIFEQMIRQTSITMQTRILETTYEPSRILQKIFFPQQRKITIEEETNLVNLLLIDISSLQSMVNQCQMNSNHRNLIRRLASSIYYVNSCQSSFISSLTSMKSIGNDQWIYRLKNLSKSLENLRRNLRSIDYLSHGYFLFQLFSIVQLLINATNEQISTKKSRTNSWKTCYFTFQWSRVFLAIKSMIIIGVGSIFVMVPYLAKIFENGQWILIALCMTQAETVGGAFTTMKMRLIGTLLGAMWSYITYLLVHDRIFETFLMLIPWIFLFAYLRLFPKWSYTAAVASFTPILVNLGRLPYGDALPGGNYALLRIEENLVGILIAIILTMTIFPVYAIDLLKDNIHKSLRSMYEVCEELFDRISMKNQNVIQSIFQEKRSTFEQLISSQRMLVSNAAIEPTFIWFKNEFSSVRYYLIVEQQIQILTMLHHIDTALIQLNEYPREVLFENEFFDLNEQMKSCLEICSDYFQSTRGLIPIKRIQLKEIDLIKYQFCLSELHRRILRLENEIDRLENQTDQWMFLISSSMFYSIVKLAHSILQLGTTIHEIFELETTNFYQPF